MPSCDDSIRLKSRVKLSEFHAELTRNFNVYMPLF